MKNYQILYDDGELIMKGQIFQARGPEEAISFFHASHPNATFIGVLDIAALSWLEINRAALQGTVDREEYYKTYP